MRVTESAKNDSWLMFAEMLLLARLAPLKRVLRIEQFIHVFVCGGDFLRVPASWDQLAFVLQKCRDVGVQSARVDTSMSTPNFVTVVFYSSKLRSSSLR